MKLLLVTEKCNPELSQRDGGARLVETFKRAFGSSLDVMQFGPEKDASSTWRFDYPFYSKNRFERRIVNAPFIVQQIKAVEHLYTHILFVHISMQFGLVGLPLREDIEVWTFPMFLTPSYRASGEEVPEHYLECERQTLAGSMNILTPSHFEKQQLIDVYSVPQEHIHVIPRGIETRILQPKIRSLEGPPRFCSIGSIKPQKNTLELISLFEKIRVLLPGSTLKIIGPMQDPDYTHQVKQAIQRQKLEQDIELTGYIPPGLLSREIQNSHMHLSTSLCETFGRAIFETLANGLPNIAQSSRNAAALFLENRPYARFVDNQEQCLNHLDEMLSNLSLLSEMAIEIGELYDDAFLSQLIVAKICDQECLAISDFDGTLFHKNDPEKTQRSLKAFRRFPRRIICSARPIHDLLSQLENLGLSVEWMIGYSGAVVADGLGNVLWQTPLRREDLVRIEQSYPLVTRIESGGQVVQVSAQAKLCPSFLGVRMETYQGISYFADWRASKLHAVHRLMRTIKHGGQVRVFGDGRYDMDLLNFFDGKLITANLDLKFSATGVN